MFNPASSEPAWEWIELYNAGSSTVDLSGYVIDDNNTSAHSSANISSGTIPAGGSAILYNADAISAADFQAAWGTVDLIGVSGWSNMQLNNGGDTIGIWSSFASYSGDHETQANTVFQLLYYASGIGIGGWPDDVNGYSFYLTSISADPNDGAIGLSVLWEVARR